MKLSNSTNNEKIQLKIENFCLYQERCEKEVQPLDIRGKESVENVEIHSRYVHI